MIPNLFDTKLIWYRACLIPKSFILVDIELIRYQAYLILNLFETKFIWYETYLISNLFYTELQSLFDTEHISKQTYQIQNLLDTGLIDSERARYCWILNFILPPHGDTDPSLGRIITPHAKSFVGEGERDWGGPFLVPYFATGHSGRSWQSLWGGRRRDDRGGALGGGGGHLELEGRGDWSYLFRPQCRHRTR